MRGVPLYGLGTTKEKVTAGLGNGRLVLEENGRLIGEACYRKVADETAEIGIKICETDCQNRGLGRIILSMLLRVNIDSWTDQPGNKQSSVDYELAENEFVDFL